ncbi:hypothetical protein GDO78_017860 [Eleutherodactylus coqui]|uniref:Uncharacterized protein n=1 Tax=Eleutherodactylus coqui TaxID=57060 RepID=A0A8J6C7K6_ELECQ|nr:hypothetical protein GDO78_017860 [Eleutherodactylus coqui]
MQLLMLGGVDVSCVLYSYYTRYDGLNLRLGSWGPIHWCKSGLLTQFSLSVQSTGSFDQTGASNIMFTCSDCSVVEGNGFDWGKYGPWSDRCKKGIRGIQTRVQDRQGFWTDDVALSDVRFLCNDN